MKERKKERNKEKRKKEKKKKERKKIVHQTWYCQLFINVKLYFGS
jgi:hypothetical protein